MTAVPEGVEIDFLLLADKAEVINGKLYMMGGGWDRLGVPDLGKETLFTVTLGFLTPWHLTNEPHHVLMRLEETDGRELARMEGDFTVGRPPESVRGQLFRSMIALQGGFKFEHYGTYSFVASVGDVEKRVTFLVHDGRGQAQPKPRIS